MRGPYRTSEPRDDEDEVFVGEVSVRLPPEKAEDEPPRRLLAAAFAAMGVAVAVASWMERDGAEAPDRAAAAPSDPGEVEPGPWTRVYGAVVATANAPHGLVGVHDRCEVSVRRDGPACDLFVVCPTAERRVHTTSCRVDAQGLVYVDDPVARLDGRAGTVVLEGAEIRLDEGRR